MHWSRQEQEDSTPASIGRPRASRCSTASICPLDAAYLSSVRPASTYLRSSCCTTVAQVSNVESWPGNRMRFQPSTRRRNFDRQGVQDVCMCRRKNALAHDAILPHSTHLREAGGDTETTHTTDRRLQLNNLPLTNYWCLLNEDGVSSRARSCTLSCFSVHRPWSG